jgi:hypothetical protein
MYTLGVFKLGSVLGLDIVVDDVDFEGVRVGRWELTTFATRDADQVQLCFPKQTKGMFQSLIGRSTTPDLFGDPPFLFFHLWVAVWLCIPTHPILLNSVHSNLEY